MCCFSGRVEIVKGTKIFVRAEGARQLVVYEMSLSATGDLAMVLPIPVALSAREDAIGFVDFSPSPHFFGQLDVLFEAQANIVGQPKSRSALAVQQVGAFEASFVPTARDFDRLDPRFSLPSTLWARVPSVDGFGFVVFKLRDAQPKSLVQRVFGVPASPPRRYHPMAFWFPRRDHERLFFPTLHVHDGDVHPTADFDHTLYAQCSSAPAGWESSADSLKKTYGFAQTMVADHIGHRFRIHGTRANEDTWIAG